MTTPATPSPLTWTLRLKSHKTTVLLHVTPLTTFTTIKSSLYAALLETTFHTATGTTIPLPASPDLIQLGRARNQNDPSRGFVLGEWEATLTPSGSDEEEEQQQQEEEGASAKGKGKARARPEKGGTGKDCPKGAGLKDGAVLAFRWVGDEMWDGEEKEEAYDMWGVQIPSLDEAYGDGNEEIGGEEEFEE